MPHLNDFIRASALMIANYHDTKLPDDPIKAAELVDELLLGSQTDLIARLNNFIDMSTVDGTRGPLLRYVLHTIDQLRAFRDSTAPLDPVALAHLKQQLTQFIIDLQKLLTTSQATQITVRYNGTDTELYGVVGRVWSGWKLSCSGELIQKCLLPSLRLSETTSQADVEKIIANVIDDHQRVLTLSARESAVTAREAAVSVREAALLSTFDESEPAPVPQQIMDDDSFPPLPAADKAKPVTSARTTGRKSTFWGSRFHSSRAAAAEKTLTPAVEHVRPEALF